MSDPTFPFQPTPFNLVPRYTKIVEAGFYLQLDCPDLAMGRHHAYSRYSSTINIPIGSTI